MRASLTAWLMLLALCPVFAADDGGRWQRIKEQQDKYRHSLNRVRQEYGGSYRLPAGDFFLFGMGKRAKFIYGGGQLRRSLTGEAIRTWDVVEEIIAPSEFTVALKTRDGQTFYLLEDEEAVWMEHDGKREALSRAPVKLPLFKGYLHAPVLRVLLQEVLINIVEGKPLPNYFVYAKPWYRDSAMLAMVLEKTDNVALIKDWVLNLSEPYDGNNNGETEADNLGQALYLISLVADKSHPLVPKIQKEFERFRKKDYIEGRSDFALHPVYQTKWAKFGLHALSLDDPFTVPQRKDTYAALFWWSFRDADKTEQPVLGDDKYPYLGWAASHYARRKTGKLSGRDYPLTWEAEASQANYEGMRVVSADYVHAKTCAPHTWHAAEAFLYLLEENESRGSNAQ